MFLLIAVVLAPMALVLGWTNFQRFLSLRDIRLQSETEVAQGIATAFAAYMSGHREHLHVTGQAILIFSPYSSEKATKVLTEGAEHSPAIRNLSWVSPDGSILASTVPELVGRSLAARPYFQEIVTGSPWIISDLHPRGSVTTSPIFFIAVEARDEAGGLRGVVVAAIGPEEVGRLTLSQDRPAAGRIALFDRQGGAVYLSPALPLSWEERAQWRQTDRLLQEAIETGEPQAGTTTLVALKGDWIAARVPVVGINWIAGAARPAEVAFAPLREGILRDISLAVLITGLAFLLAFFLAASIARPLLRLQLATCRMGEGEAVAIDPHAPAEVQSLGRTMSEMAANLLTAKKSAEEANLAKSVFLANMSHELRTPMTVIMGSLEFLQDPSSDPDKDQLLELSSTSAQRLLGIIDDLLDISKIEAGRIRIEERAFALRECVRDVVEMFTASAQENGVRLSWQVAPQLPSHIMGDPGRISQVLTNLVGNAVKFTKGGEVTLKVEGVDEELIFTVRDTGMGIPKDKVEQIFQPFVQVDPSLTRRHPGSGLGLAISKELVALMEGVIGVKSLEGEGSTFTFSIPLRVATVIKENDLVQPSTKSVHQPVKILLAEDEPSVRELVTMSLHRKGIDVAIAETGRQAVELWQREKFDLILMDLQMPEMDGLEATRVIRDLERAGGEKTCIFALTAHAREEDRERCMTAGMDGFLTKPLRFEKLVALIEHCPCGLHSV